MNRLNWRTLLVILTALVAALGLAGVMAPSAAQAANATVTQCNGQIPSEIPNSKGASTIMNCDVTVTNNITGGITSSVSSVTAICANDQCTTSGPVSQTDLITVVNQCNGSDNDAALTINCNVHIINNISADTPGAQPVNALTLTQCGGGSAQGGGGSNTCSPPSASTSGPTVDQCVGSANGGGGTINCSATGFVSGAIPITVTQCNGTGNKGGSTVNCTVDIQTNIIPVAVVTPTPTPTSTPSVTPTGTPTTPTGGGSGGTGGTPTSPATIGGTGNTPGTPTAPGTIVGAPIPTAPATVAAVSQVPLVPTGGIATGGGSTAGLRHSGLLLLGTTLLFAAGFGTLVRRRFVLGS